MDNLLYAHSNLSTLLFSIKLFANEVAAVSIEGVVLFLVKETTTWRQEGVGQ